MRKTVLLLVLCLCLPVWGLSTVTKIVDPDNGGGTHYTTLDAYEDALGGTTSGHLPNDDQIAIAECRSSSGTNDTAPVDFDGWTTDATRYIKITGTDFPSDGIFDGTKYLLAMTDATLVTVKENYWRIEYIQFQVTQTSGNAAVGLTISNSAAGDNLRYVSNCIFKGVTDTGSPWLTAGINVSNGNAIVKIWNCIVYDFFISGDNDYRGIEIFCATTDLYNNTVAGCTKGIGRSGGTVTAINCAVFDNTDDFTGTITVDYCATDEHGGAGTNGVNISATWDTTCFVAPEASPPNYAVQDASSPIYQTGNGATPKALFVVDIIGTTMGPADLDWPIGAFEYVAAAPPGGQFIMIQMSMIPLFLIFTLVCFIRGKEIGK